ncbi:hypothetical protein DWF00_17310 [Bosea caraganae]|uniref:Uncharacterized protein n=1 Tax=Bosea caraganae TaxID=2763117 RepID=A0A370L7F8_9HYPH|nr:hypothetical protein [Bosea caraganae]RDJ24967.1 hypothetical protein DWF00_17310 [Bosea caraganae]RDJ26078.1 hypothetical protein DWE98_09530 [Bosea caraganae]
MTRLRFTTAQEVFETFPSARKLVSQAPTGERPLAFLAKLLDGPEPQDAVSFCAFLLPRRETVWWAVQSLRSLQPPGRSDAALTAAEAWVRNPDDATRRAALAIGEAGDPEQASTWVALSAGYSGGSMVASHSVPCPPDFTAKTARVAVLAAIRQAPQQQRDAALRGCIEACIRLANDDGGKARA